MVDNTIEDAQPRVNTPYVLPDRTKTPRSEHPEIDDALTTMRDFFHGKSIMFYREVLRNGVSIEAFPSSIDPKKVIWLARMEGDENVMNSGEL